MLKSDLAALHVKLPLNLTVSLGGEHVTDNVWGWHISEDNTHRIELLGTLSGAMLYLTLLHEAGHALGLNHYAHGVMAPELGERKGELTLRSRRKWLRDFTRRLMTKRLETLQ